MALSRRHAAVPRQKVDRTTRPIDLVHLARQTFGDRMLECEVLRLFEQQVRLYFDRVRTTTDREELAIGLHTLKGASAGVGAVVLADLAGSAEIEFRETGGLEEETLADMAMAVEEVCAYIARLVVD
ncbi:Hpt domain-containing protein [Pelagibacterium montanilacus]|uniref:Hpt domain-containing protein n=1 Tax=Pelagibacterium montanilacus TaxID=2185280 RepID=UPI000F8EE258|nr:Hpt domain-containing protein [Pelagibacterium montanilacus]